MHAKRIYQWVQPRIIVGKVSTMIIDFATS